MKYFRLNDKLYRTNGERVEVFVLLFGEVETWLTTRVIVKRGILSTWTINHLKEVQYLLTHGIEIFNIDKEIDKQKMMNVLSS